MKGEKGDGLAPTVFFRRRKKMTPEQKLEAYENCAATIVDIIEDCNNAYDKCLLEDALDKIDQLKNQLESS